MTECHSDPGVGHHAVVEVQIGSTNRRHRHPDDRVVGMLNRRHFLLFDAHLVGAAVDHRSHAVRSTRKTTGQTSAVGKRGPKQSMTI
jgi:hypothetical protein